VGGRKQRNPLREGVRLIGDSGLLLVARNLYPIESVHNEL
jgi:hypothetical protein